MALTHQLFQAKPQGLLRMLGNALTRRRPLHLARLGHADIDRLAQRTEFSNAHSGQSVPWSSPFTKPPHTCGTLSHRHPAANAWFKVWELGEQAPVNQCSVSQGFGMLTL
jgi:hypothetical protein